MNLRDISPARTDRAVLIGRTGSGKTTVAREICSARDYVVVYDHKLNLRWPGFQRFHRLQELQAADPVKIPKMIYAPCPDEFEDVDAISDFFKFAYFRGNTTVYVDEIYSVCSAGGRIPKWYKLCFTQGREMGVSTISSTQRPKDIPQVALSEAEHWYIFQLLMEQDREKVSATLPVPDEAMQKLRPHQFIYANHLGVIIGADKPLKMVELDLVR